MQIILALFISLFAIHGFSKSFVYNSIQDVFYQTVLIQGDQLICTGVIINDQQIATAAHCAENFKNRNPQVYFNVVDKNNKTLNESINSFEIHPLYKNKTQLSYDIAKITLKNKIPSSLQKKLSDRLVLNESLPVLFETTYVLGYGLSQLALSNSEQFNAEIQKPVFRIKELNLKNDVLQYDKEIMIYKNHLAQVCTNDSGSPFIAKSATSNQFFLLGFTVAVLEKDVQQKTCRDRVSFLNLDSVYDWLIKN